MLTINQIVIRQDSKVIQQVKSLQLTIRGDALYIYAELTDGDDNIHCFVVRDISIDQHKNVFIDVGDIDFTPQQIEQEKIVDIRNFINLNPNPR